MPSSYNDSYQGIVLEVLIDNNKLKTKPIFVNQNKYNFNLSLAKEMQVKELQQNFQNYTLVIQNKKALNESWEEFIENKSNSYLKIWSPFTFIKNKYIKAILNKLGFKFNNKQAKAKYLNLMRCESHAELSVNVIGENLKKL